MSDDFLVQYLLKGQAEDAVRIQELEKELALWKKDTTRLVFELKSLHEETGWESTAALLGWWAERNQT